jgi:hypothetical protein
MKRHILLLFLCVLSITSFAQLLPVRDGKFSRSFTLGTHKFLGVTTNFNSGDSLANDKFPTSKAVHDWLRANAGSGGGIYNPGNGIARDGNVFRLGDLTGPTVLNGFNYPYRFLSNSNYSIEARGDILAFLTETNANAGVWGGFHATREFGAYLFSGGGQTGPSATHFVRVNGAGPSPGIYLKSPDPFYFQTPGFALVPNGSIFTMIDNATGRSNWRSKTDLNLESKLVFSTPFGRTVDTVSMPASSPSSDGYLQASKFSEFDAKVPSTRQVNTAAPLTGGGPLSGNITVLLPKGGNAQDGYIAKEDFQEFMSRVPATRTLNTSGPLTGGGNFSADRTIGINMSDAVTDGYLAAADYSKFAAKPDSCKVVNDSVFTCWRNGVIINQQTIRTPGGGGGGGSSQIVQVTTAILDATSALPENVIFWTTDVGKEGQWRYAGVAANQSTDNGGTIIISPDNKTWKRVYSGGLFANWFGATPDFVSFASPGTDDAVAINKAIQVAGFDEPIYLDFGNYYLTSTVAVPQTKRPKVRFFGNVHAALGVNAVTVFGAFHDIRFYGAIRGPGAIEQTTGYHTNQGVGLGLYNCKNGAFEIKEITGFYTGLEVAGVGTGAPEGSQLNNIYLNGKIYWNHTNVRFTVKDAADQLGNWCNGNVLWGGQIGNWDGIVGSGGGRKGGAIGILFDKDPSAWGNNLAPGQSMDKINGIIINGTKFEGNDTAFQGSHVKLITVNGGNLEPSANNVYGVFADSTFGMKFTNMYWNADAFHSNGNKWGSDLALPGCFIYTGSGSLMGFEAMASGTQTNKLLSITNRYDPTAFLSTHDVLSYTPQFPKTQAFMYRVNQVTKAIPFKSTANIVNAASGASVTLKENTGYTFVNVDEATDLILDAGTFGANNNWYEDMTFEIVSNPTTFPITVRRSDNNAIVIPSSTFSAGGVGKYRGVYRAGGWAVWKDDGGGTGGSSQWTTVASGIHFAGRVGQRQANPQATHHIGYLNGEDQLRIDPGTRKVSPGLNTLNNSFGVLEWTDNGGATAKVITQNSVAALGSGITGSGTVSPASDKVLISGSPNGATLQNVSIDVDETKINQNRLAGTVYTHVSRDQSSIWDNTQKYVVVFDNGPSVGQGVTHLNGVLTITTPGRYTFSCRADFNLVGVGSGTAKLWLEQSVAGANTWSPVAGAADRQVVGADDEINWTATYSTVVPMDFRLVIYTTIDASTAGTAATVGTFAAPAIPGIFLNITN